MILSAEVDIINRDQGLPGLSLLFDSEALGKILRQYVNNVDIGVPQSYYLRYKPRTNCLVAYHLPVNGESVIIYAKAFCYDDRHKFHKWKQKTTIVGVLGNGNIALDNWLTIVTVIPNDFKIQGLFKIVDRENQDNILKKIFSQKPELWTGEVKRLRYKPERRYVAQLLVEKKPKALIKAYTSEDYHNISRKIKKFSSQGNLCLAKTLGRSRRYQIISYEWLEGSLLTEILMLPNCENSVWENVGKALGELHQQKLSSKFPRVNTKQEISTLQSTADWLTFIYPPFSQIINNLTKKLCHKLSSISWVNCSIHGDFYADQVLLMEDNMIGILDLDRAIIGNPTADIGNFIAHLERQVLYDNLSPDFIDRACEHLLLGYEGTCSYSVRPQLNLYLAICLFRLVPEPFRSRNSNWVEKMRLILDRIDQILLESA